MKHSIRLLLAGLLLPAQALAELPNNPRPEFVYVEPEYAVACAPDRFLWQSNYAYDRKSMEIRPDKKLPFKEQVVETCTVGDQKVSLVLTSEAPPHEHCRATTLAHMDMWVDGKPVIARLSWGSWMGCMQGVEVHEEEITRVIFDKNKQLSICHDTPQHTSECETKQIP